MKNENIVFENRRQFSYKLQQLMVERSYTKARFCEEVGISRPTLDKLLSGNVTSLATFEKHVNKIADCLGINPRDMVREIRIESEAPNDRYLMHIVSEKYNDIEDFVNAAKNIDVINISSYNDGEKIYHVLWYWFYPEKEKISPFNAKKFTKNLKHEQINSGE